MKLVLLLLTLSLNANAASFKQFYATATGLKLEAPDAIVKALKGDEIYKCQSVEAKVSKSGTTIGIKNTKKPKE